MSSAIETGRALVLYGLALAPQECLLLTLYRALSDRERLSILRFVGALDYMENIKSPTKLKEVKSSN